VEDPRDVRIAKLEELLKKALAEIVVLKARIVVLEAQLGRNSNNSSQPPSSNGPGFVPRKKPKSTKKRGGQIGHKGHHRIATPQAEVSSLEDHLPTVCQGCGAGLEGEDSSPWRHQVSELPEIKAHITEHRIHALRCKCGVVTRASISPQIVQSHFGPKLTAMVSVLAGAYRLSHQNVGHLLSDSFAVKISTSSITTLEQRVSAAIAAPVAEAQASLKSSTTVHCDETSWRQSGLLHWLWVMANQQLCILTIAPERNAEVAKMLLQDFHGILHTDRYGAYSWYPIENRQLCWAHLKRDFEAFGDYGVEEKTIGTKLLFATRHLFRYWNQRKSGEMSTFEFQKRLKSLKTRVLNLLCVGGALPTGKVSRACKRIFRLRAALFVFVSTPDVQPTNNHAESLLRHSVIWRKTSFGTNSDAGTRFAERILSVIATLKLQHRNVFQWVTETYSAFVNGLQLPSLLPSPQMPP
jgi:transposase